MIAPGATHIGRLRASRAARQGLAGAELNPPGLPPAAILIVRRLVEPLPASLSRPDSPWERRVRGRLETLYRHAARPARGTVPADARAVVFEDESELLACLALDLARGRYRQCWWWRTLLGRLKVDRPATLLQDHGRQLPAVLARLVEGDRVVEVLAAFSDGEVADLWRVLVEVHRLDSKLLAVVPEAGDDRPPAAIVRPLPAAPPLQPRPPPWTDWLPRSHASLSPVQTLLLGVGLTLFYAPVRVRSALFAAQVWGWWSDRRIEQLESSLSQETGLSSLTASDSSAIAATPSNEQATEGTALATPSPPGESSLRPPGPAPSFPSHRRPPRVREPGFHAGAWEPSGHGSGPSRDVRSSGPPGDGLGSSGYVDTPAGKRLRQPAATLERAEAALWSRPEADAFGGGVLTGLGGILYLINLLEYLEREPGESLIERGSWGLVEGVARFLLEGTDVQDDPVWSVLAHLDEREPGEPFDPPPWLAAACPRLRNRLVEALDSDHPGDLLAVPGWLYVTPTHVDLVASLEAISLPVRRAGLDRDPGWVGWLGRVVSFHFQRAE